VALGKRPGSTTKLFCTEVWGPTNDLWLQLLDDLTTYFAFYISIRGAFWNLRLASLKRFAPMWAAAGHYNYDFMIARHFIDLQNWPIAIIRILIDGAFSMNLTSGKLNGVGIDEGLEMKSSKGFASIVRVTDESCLKAASVLNFGPLTESIKNYLG